MRTRSIVKCSGLAVCALICAAWVVTVVGSNGFYAYSRYAASLRSGAVYVVVMHDAVSGYVMVEHSQLVWLPRHYTLPGPLSSAGGHGFDIPLWLPFVVIAIPTFIAWRRDRKPPPGHCPCGYNLTGNVSGRCPECGAHIEASP